MFDKVLIFHVHILYSLRCDKVSKYFSSLVETVISTMVALRDRYEHEGNVSTKKVKIECMHSDISAAGVPPLLMRMFCSKSKD